MKNETSKKNETREKRERSKKKQNESSRKKSAAHEAWAVLVKYDDGKSMHIYAYIAFDTADWYMVDSDIFRQLGPSENLIEISSSLKLSLKHSL